MKTKRRPAYPSIVPHLVLPFERPYFEGKCRFPALVFARRGSLVLFAVECTRQFGVGLLDGRGSVTEPDHFATLDTAASAFLSMVRCIA